MLNMSVDSANRMNYVNSSFGRTLLSTVVTIKGEVPRGGMLISSNTTGDGTRLLRPYRVLTIGNCGVCKATKATGFLGRGNVSTATIY